MNLKSSDGKRFLFLLYPVVVMVFIAMSLNLVLAEPEKWQKLFNDQSGVESDETRVQRLRTRLDVLRSMDLVSKENDLKFTLKAVPPAKRVWLLISELKQVASSSGVVLERYKGTVGNVKEATGSAIPVVTTSGTDLLRLDVTFLVNDVGQVWSILNQLEKSLPLVKIVKARYVTGSLNLIVEGAWGNWAKVAADVNTPLPEETQEISLLREKLAEFVELPEVIVNASDSAEFESVNPF